jgi:nicotinamide-nucleotide amidase
MFEASVLPILKSIPGLVDASTECRIYHVVGMGESAVEEVIGLELNARGDLEVGYCARPNEVDFRLIGPPAILEEVEPSVLAALGPHIVSQSGRNLEEVVIGLLRAQRATVATAESCTGGLVASRLTDVSGSSEVFMEGMVTYSNAAKTRTLGVPPDLIATHGAVSEPVALAMAEGARARANTRFALSLTGVAGPTGGTPEKPVGTVFIALAEDGQPTICLHEKFPTDRETFKRLASQTALDLLRRRLLKDPSAS